MRHKARWRAIQQQWLAHGLLLLAVLTRVAAGGDDPPPKKIAPHEAAAHVGAKCVVEMEVRSSRRGENPIVFLNSEEDFRVDRNFTVVIFEAGLERFRDQGVTDPAAHFAGKRIRVTGTIEEFKGRPQIRADQPRQIEIVNPPASSSNKP
ncbi:MAG: hypothetical protein JNG90_06795 [Planctomycetaceae bacterium]|nr:hypothetical protein [Planctomycetaceae bacterium]